MPYYWGGKLNMTDELELTQDMKDAIDREGDPVLYEVTTLGIRTFARAVGYTNTKYYDEDAAQAAGHSALPSPPGYLGMPIWNPNKEPSRQPTFNNPFTRNLNGGTQVQPIEQVYAGDVLSAVSRITNLTLSPSKSLGKMLIRETETVYTRQSDGVVVAKTQGQGISY